MSYIYRGTLIDLTVVWVGLPEEKRREVVADLRSAIEQIELSLRISETPAEPPESGPRDGSRA